MATNPEALVRILHVSDTHGLHRSVEHAYPMPEADILIHTGDFTDDGTLDEIRDFNEWLGELTERYPHRIVIFGNHEYKRAHDPTRTKSLLPNALVLDHEAVDILGLTIFGSPWVPGHRASAPGDNGKVAHRFDEIPEGVDMLLTHGSPFGIMDCCELKSIQWGGSKALHKEVLRARPRAHLFGHMHEQRGVWYHQHGEDFQGGIEYELANGEVHPTWGAPPADYPCELISCNAMKNHPNIDAAVGKERVSCIAGPARLIIAKRGSDAEAIWRFHSPGTSIGNGSVCGGS